MNKELTVKVVADGYIEVAESSDPCVIAEVLAMLAKHPETAEHQQIRTLRSQVSKAESITFTEKVRADKLEKQVAELQKKLDAAYPVN